MGTWTKAVESERKPKASRSVKLFVNLTQDGQEPRRPVRGPHLGPGPEEQRVRAPLALGHAPVDLHVLLRRAQQPAGQALLQAHRCASLMALRRPGSATSRLADTRNSSHARDYSGHLFVTSCRLLTSSAWGRQAPRDSRQGWGTGALGCGFLGKLLASLAMPHSLDLPKP